MSNASLPADAAPKKVRQGDRLIINVLANYGRRGMEALTAIVVTPMLTRYLTKEGFGAVALVISCLAIFRLLSTGMGRALQRQMPLDIAGGEPEPLRRTFNTALVGYAAVGLLGGIVTLLLKDWMLRQGTQLSPELLADANKAFWLLAGWLVVFFPCFAYRRGLEAIQRFDIDGVNTSLMTVIRMVVVLILFPLGIHGITIYMIIELSGWLFVGYRGRKALKRELPTLVESPKYVSWAAAKNLNSIAGLSVIISVGQILSVHGLNFVTATQLGFAAMGALAGVRRITRLLGDVINNLTNALTPAVATMDASGSHVAIGKLMNTGSKFAVAAAAAMCMVPVPAMGSVMVLWLGDEFTGLQGVLLVTMLTQVPVAMGSASQQVLTGLGKLGFITPVLFLRGAVGVLAAWVYVRYIDASLVGATACVFGARAVGAVIVHMYAAAMTDTLKPKPLAETIGLPCLFGAVGAGLVWLIFHSMGGAGWMPLIVSVCGGEVVFCGLMVLFGLNNDERVRIGRFLKRAAKFSSRGRGKVETQP